VGCAASQTSDPIIAAQTNRLEVILGRFDLTKTIAQFSTAPGPGNAQPDFFFQRPY